MKKLSEIIGNKKGVELEFVDMIIDESQRDGSPIVHLMLKTPIAAVFGRRVTDNVSGESVTLEANDVERVSIGKEALDYIEQKEAEGVQFFTWTEEGKAGTLKCDLKLDVSQQLDVYVVKTSFSQFGRQQRTARQQQQRSNLINKVNEQKTRRAFAGTNVNENELVVTE